MENSNENDLLPDRLESFCKINEQFRLAFKVTEGNSKLDKSQKIDLHLHYLSRNIFPVKLYFKDVVAHFPEFLPKIVSIAITFDEQNDSLDQHIINCVLLGNLIKVRSDLGSYAYKYFEKNPPPFVDEASSSKRRKISQDITVTDLDLVESCYVLLKSDPNFYVKKWQWSEFADKYLDHDSEEVRWIACHCISIVTGMSEKQLKKLILSKLPLETHERLSCIYKFSSTLAKNDKTTVALDQHPCIAVDKTIISEVVEIAGIYIPKLPCFTPPDQKNLVIVKTTYNNLKKIALGLSSNQAICLQGPVGSGKTSLVEYLASKTGRKLGENFIKVQLGDQTDSKMLLGTYRCTDIPGEFIWQPGVLTQAVIEGHWLLLEDIDSASMDIASVLSGLLENGSLSVPGYRDSLTVSSDFQLFVTQRLVSTITGHHKKHSSAMTLLDKHLLQINVDPLTSEELKEILTTYHPEFATIAERMLRVFHLFARSDHHEIAIPKTSRLISTRDFFKWCSRAAVDFDISSQASALKVLQDAIDVFCCSFPRAEDALNLAKQISTHLGIINQKAEFFFTAYKPNMRLTTTSLDVGRASLPRNNEHFSPSHRNYYFTRPSSVLLERIMCCVNLKEPVLLVGETGTGKTSSIQYLASAIGQQLVVINMNQQSDSADLLGGFKPVDLKFVIGPIRAEFEAVFRDYFQVGPNKTFLGHVARCFNEQRWSDLVALMTHSCEAAVARLTKAGAEKAAMLGRWRRVGEKLRKLQLQLRQKAALAFSFVEGSLVRAVERGHWVLLDEINLANAETLECLSGLLEGSEGSLCLLERGDEQPVRRNANFTLFACMNPSTDVGKRDLPAGLRNRFTEFFVDELTERSDLLLLVDSYLDALSLKSGELEKIVDLYLRLRKETETSLTDGLGHKPHFSLRSLCRALTITARNPCGTVKKSMYEAFCLSFLTQLDLASYSLVEKMIARYLVGDDKCLKAVKNQPIPEPKDDTYVQFEGYWIRKGSLDCVVPEDYILTESVRKNLKDLVRIVSIGRLPVLLQGDTSVGKTSLIAYLAKASGNKCVRINNHEHTDLQEYIGSYVADYEGKLVFREGLLVEAMRKGHWIILDELNLAPTDVLEALNRVLDDNRELFIPETQETVKADPNFMLFATQNPPGSYGGRKMLSRAFRNRFVELHFNEIPPAELEFILHERCQMSPSYAKKMISVMTDLQMRRRGSAAFAGKKGFITLRDLFRWGERYRLAQNSHKLYDWDQHLADEGYLVLAGRVRKGEEKREIIDVLQKHLKRDVNPWNLFTLTDNTSNVTRDILVKIDENRCKYPNIVWTYNMRQLAVLVAKAFQFKEPVLLVGETGGGKTTVCQLIAELNGQDLLSVNCHMHTESSDFIGGLRPVRDHVDDEVGKLFEWVDGPLIKAMTKGSVFLADEISLADDSVLERLNSLLEPERTLLLAEKGIDINNTENSELVVAEEGFHFIGTMNPGGDFGKKELSPALRNRFTEIWCETCTDRGDLIAIIESNVKSGICLGNQEDGSSGIGKRMMEFVDWFKSTEIGKRCTISIRDILTWVNFINACAEKMSVYEAYLHGVYLTFLDGLGSGVTGTENLHSLNKFKRECERFIIRQLQVLTSTEYTLSVENLKVEETDQFFGIKPFFIELGSEDKDCHNFSFNAPTTLYNTLRLLRGMQLNKAILLEGSPGVGKTSLVTAVAKFARHKVFRVNLSDQTDISDLFGADLPVEGGTGGQFSWRDGPLLQALKQGHWILLDELNLASQSVLEGLNACLDHRGEIFIPELAKTFHVEPGTRFFACQNPSKQGGSRRGLPRSFLNRFIQVHVSSLTDEDLALILSDQFPAVGSEILGKMLKFNSRVVSELDAHSFGNRGSPWEFNLRDLTRWCEAMIYQYETNPSVNKRYRPESSVQLIYSDRMRTLRDKIAMEEIFRDVFGRGISGDAPVLYVNEDKVCVGDVILERNVSETSVAKNYLVLRSQLGILRSLGYCVNLNWMSLLVGGSGSGKSSVVRVLASLMGKTLRTLPVTSAMDTTDILGGFEQTDYARHLEEVVRETERVVLKTARSLLVKDRPWTGLLRVWEAYSEVDCELKSKRTMEEETGLFLEKLDALETIFATLLSIEECREKDTVEDLARKVEKLRQLVREEGSLNSGGKFEWVDSVLIKCLRDGCWLLVDNVNLCSAAVLDRLNALLEPKGVLTVSERGVDERGGMVEISPHPEFRLFLSMDPKNGEISRAMRNRGVEIYILSERERGRRDELDVKSLICRQGLTATSHIDRLLTLHDFITDLISGEKPNVNELLRAAALIARQIRHGTDARRAFSDTITEVYYKTRTPTEFSCNDFATVIASELEKIGSSHGHFADSVTLNTARLHVCSSLEKIGQQAAVLTPDKGVHPLIHFFGIGSGEELRLRARYLPEEWSELAAAFCEFLAERGGAFPLDGGWIPDADYEGKNRAAGNSAILGLHMIAKLEGEKSRARDGFSLLEYMEQRRLRRVEDRFDDVLVDKFLDLIEAYNSFLVDNVRAMAGLTDKELVEILELTSWRFVFYAYTSVDVEKTDAKRRHRVLTNLRVHYRWFFKYAVEGVKNFFGKSPPPPLESLIEAINARLEEEFSALHKLGRRFQKVIDKPPPRVSSDEIELNRQLDKRLKMLDSSDRNNDVMKVLTVFKNDPTLRTKLVNLRPDGGENAMKLLKSTSDLECAQFSKYESQLFPVFDYFVLLQVRRTVMGLVTEGLGKEITPYLTLPIGLDRSLSLYIKSGDKRLVHELMTAFFKYQTNAICLVRILSESSPVLTYHLTNLLVGEAVTTFGNFRQLTRQHRQLNMALWFNFRQMQDPSYDYLSNQRRFVVATFELFVRTLAEALGVEETDSDRLIQVCSERSGDLSTRLKKCAASYLDLKSGRDGFEGSLLRVYNIHMELSYSKAVLNSRLSLIDPSAKKALKKKYCAESVRNFEDWRDSLVDANRVYSGNDKSLHPHHLAVTEMLESLRRRDQKLGSYVAVRPADVLYDEVVKAVNHGFSTILSRQYIDRIISSLDKSIRDLIGADGSFCEESSESKQYEVAVSSFENLINEWSKYRASYPDVIEPVLSNVSEFLFGLKSNLALLRKLQLRHAYKKFDVQRGLVSLIQMPSIDPNHIRYELSIEICSNAELHDFIRNVLKNDEFPNVAKQAILRLVKCGVQESFNNCILETRAAGVGHFAQFDRFVRAFVEAWNEQEKRREIEEKEAGSLYKMKTKCDDGSEEEQIERELKELFPNYHSRDFADMRKLTSLSDDPEPQSIDNKFAGVISNEDIKFVVDLHITLLQSTTKAEWLNPERNKNAQPDFINPLIEKYKVFKQILDKIVSCLDYRMDKELVESLNVLLAFVQNYGNTDLIDHRSPSKAVQNRRDFYKDANVEEVKSSFHILEELRLRIAELLDEWPDHPTLQTIETVINRIYDFDISSPVSRFLTGFEILLSKCNEWEEVAHSGVSLSRYSQNITHQIIAWRKMELNVWRDLLNATFERLNEPMYRWWLYLYNVMDQFTKEEKFGDVELIETLQTYITKSNLAEFQTRLSLLHVFHCHVVHNERSERADAFVNILWNLYNYFRQFSPTVANKIKELKAPIEKKLREYVKIVRWKDINYWAIKETVDKSHKTLHKFVREYQEVLRQPVVRYLVNANSSSGAENVGIWDRPQRHLLKTYHYTLDPATYVAKESFKKKLSSKTSTCHGILLNKIDSCFVEARKLCKETITGMQYARMIQNLDNFVTQIIETSSHLQGLEVDTTLPKEKQKSLARSILHQKHRALADLFKTLSKIGLSFKSGIVEAKLKLATEDFTLKPIDISANFSHINYNRKDEKILTIWDGCEMYYLKSLMRADVLDTALKTPAPDLGLPNVERCRGFSANLLTFAQRQKKRLTEASNMFYYLRHYTTQLTKLCEGKRFLSLQTVEEMQTLMKNVAVVMSQARIVLATYPEEEVIGSETAEVVVLEPSRCLKNDPSWNKVGDFISEALALSNKINAELEKCKGEIPGTVLNVIRLQFIPIPDLNAFESKLDEIGRNIQGVAAVFGTCKLGDSCSWLVSEIGRLRNKLNELVEDEFDEKTAVGRLAKLADAITDNISTVVQKLHQKYSEQAGESAQEDSEEIQIEENHLKVSIVENLENDFRDLGVAEILDRVQEIAEIFFPLNPDQLTEAKDIVSYVLPLLEQIILYHQYFLTQQVSAYRVTSKMNSVLLNIFIELASKGFCVPPELTDEEEGVGKPSDGLGLGEGKGEKDVSDKIESEDQLDDAQPAGQEKNQEEDADCREEDKGIEMSEDFDSKLQDVDRKEDDEEQEDSESDGEEQMGETEKDANKQDKQTFGSEDEDGDEQNEEKEERGEGGEKQGEQEMGAKQKDSSKTDENPDEDNGKEKEEKKKEINEMEEPEIDDDQTDPYHGNQPELPEPEPMDLPDDLQLDEGQEQDNENEEGENPFDIDAMKEDNPFENKDKEENEEQNDEENDEAKNFSSDDEDIRKEQDDEESQDKDKERNETTEKTDEGEAEEKEEMKESEESGLDQTQTKEDNVEAMEVDNADASDKTQANEDLNQKSNQPIEELCQEDKPDKEGVGQSQMEESTTGHSAQTTAPQEIQSAKRPREEEEKKKQKPGESDSKRSLGDVKEPVKKKLKTIDPKREEREEGGENEEETKNEEAEMYKHIKEAKEGTTQTLDVATEEQAESQKNEVPNLEEEETGEEPTESSDKLPEEEETEIEEATDVPVQKPETSDSKKKNNKKQHPEGDAIEEITEMEVEGEIVETMGVERGADTTYNTLYEELKKLSAARLTAEEMDSLRSEVEQQLSAWSEAPSDVEADRAWQKISSVTTSLAQDLAEQLRLVLEPTQASRLKGDFRTGRRINMRKVIPYIASQFRKDKIWLRRTKPSKREYQIVLAIDDSSSMADNHSKELAFESVALISKALSLLESGQLSVVSFGEKTEILHKLADQFTDKSGVKLLQRFKFDQNKTCVAKLVDFVTEMFAQAQVHSVALNAKLLVVVSDGRGVFSEGETVVRQAVRRARLAGIFMVFVIVDSPENKNSILDIRMPVFKEGKLLGIQNYMDVFPFSFYIILRDINSLPSVLSDALRQWFEVVSNLDKQ